ncbi:hypothetical protein WAI453_004924 [Rhynchosporium graminicola]|uniref:Uncharacterized protein n=1 Tax=Rhynchosporium graminicola TaxID=2792576 RepID=A0A1E1L5B4_9HELO|nr:uncharacterized protein RCO7_08421 [Rhynchosporium commune]
MKLGLLSALFISSALSAAINDVGLEARQEIVPQINDAGLEGRATAPSYCTCSMTQGTTAPYNMIGDNVPIGGGFIKRYVYVRNSIGTVIDVCWIAFTRAPECGNWVQTSPRVSPACKNLGKSSCVAPQPGGVARKD